MCLSEFLRYIWIVWKFKIWCDWMVYWCVQWSIQWGKVWSRHSIFRKGNNVLRLLLGCIDLCVSCEWNDSDSTDIMESYKWSYSVCES